MIKGKSGIYWLESHLDLETTRVVVVAEACTYTKFEVFHYYYTQTRFVLSIYINISGKTASGRWSQNKGGYKDGKNPNFPIFKMVVSKEIYLLMACWLPLDKKSGVDFECPMPYGTFKTYNTQCRFLYPA
jgi:hypothetical protein